MFYKKFKIFLFLIFIFLVFSQEVYSDIYGLLYNPVDELVYHTVGGTFDDNIFDFDPSQLDFSLNVDPKPTEPTQLETAAKHVYYHIDYPSIAVTRESSVDVYYTLMNPNNPANTMEVEVYVYKDGDTIPDRNSEPLISSRFTNPADFDLVHKINVDIGGFLPQGGLESPLVNIELRFSEYAGTIEVGNKIPHENDDMKHYIVYDPLPPEITNESSKQLFVKWNETLGLTKVNEELNTNFPIYGPLKFLFRDSGSRHICLYNIDDLGIVDQAEIKIYRKVSGGVKDYLPEAYYSMSITKDIDATADDQNFLVLKIENWNHYFYPRTQYFIEWVNGPWDKSGNEISADSKDIINDLKFQTDENPPVFADEGLLDPLIDEEDVNIYGSIKLNFDEMIDTESFENAFKLILDETGQEIKIMDYEFIYDTGEFVHRIRILPQDPLVYSKNYAININNNFKDVAGYSISGINYKFTTELDTTPPQEKAIYPFNNQTGLPHSTGIYVQFDGRMDETTFTTDNIKILRGTSPIAFSYIYENEGSNLYIFPNNKLIPDTTYTVNISTGLKDLSGNSLTSPLSWNFKTIEQEENYASVSLEFIENAPIDSTYVDGQIELTFTKDMEHSELLKGSNYILYDGHRNIELTVEADPMDQYRKFILKTKKGTYGFSWYPDDGYFFINREYKLYTLPFLKDRSGSYIIKSLIKDFKTVDTVKPRVLSAYPWGVSSDIQKVDISEKLDYARVYFDEEVVFNAANDKVFYNDITDDVSDSFPVSIDYTELDGTPIIFNYDAIYYSEVLDNIDYNQDGYKDDYFLEIFNSTTDSIYSKEIFPEGTYEIKVKLGPFGVYEIEDVQNNSLESEYSMKFVIKNLYGDLSLDTEWFSASPSVYDTAELKTKYALKPEVKIVFTDKLVKNIPDFDEEKAKLALYILADTNNNGIFTDETPVYGDLSYDEVSINEELKYIVTYNALTHLPQNTDCRFMVKSDAINLTNINGAPLPADTYESFETMDNPIVISVFPQNNSNDISVNSHILVTFSEPMLESSINESSLYIIDSEEVKVNSEIYYDIVNNTARIVPVAPLTPDKEYFIVADKVWNSDIMQYISVKDYFDNDLAFKESFKFKTENKIDNVKPQVLSTLPIMNTNDFPVRGGTFEVVFSELMDDSTLDGDNKTITPDDRKKFHLLYNFNEELHQIDDRYILPYYSDIDRKATFFAGEKNGIYTNDKIDFQLRNNTIYYLKVDNTVQDISGNNLDNIGTMIATDSSYSIRFKTVSEAILPVVENSYADVSSNSNILRIDFSEVLSYTKDFKGFFSLMYRPDVVSSWTNIPESNYSVINSTKIKLRNSVAPYYKQEITTASIIPGINEFNNGFYRVLISNSNGVETLKDLSNNGFVGTVVDIEIKDDYIPYIIEKSPEGNGIPIIKEKSFVWMRFSERMNENSDSSSPLWASSVRNPLNMKLEKLIGGIPDSIIPIENIIYYNDENGVDLNDNDSVNDKNLLFVYFDQDLEFNTNYRFTISDVADTDGNSDLIVPVVWEFKTKATATPPLIEKIALINSTINSNKVEKIKIKFITDSEIDIDAIAVNPENYIKVNKLGSAAVVPVTFNWEDGNNTLILTLNNDLQLDTTYFINITGNVQDVDFKTLDGNINGYSEGSPVDDYIYRFKTDTTKKLIEVISSNPAYGSNTVDSSTGISLYFDTQLEENSILYGDLGNINLFKSESPEVTVDCKFTLLSDAKMLLLKPKEKLENNREYTLILKSGESGIKSVFGYYLDGNRNNIYEEGMDNFLIKFKTTTDIDNPYVLTDFCNPSEDSINVLIEDDIEIVFSERLHDDILSNIPGYISLYSGLSGAGGSVIPYEYTYEDRYIGNVERFVVILNPVMMLANENDYSISVNASVKDTTGNYLVNSVNYSFSTKAKDFSFTAFSNPAKSSELFIIAKYNNPLDDLSVSILQNEDSIITFSPVKTNDNPYVYFYKYELKQNKLGVLMLNAKAKDGVLDLNSGMIFKYGIINSAPMRTVDGNFSVKSSDIDRAVLLFSNRDKQNINNAPLKTNEISELEEYSSYYSIDGGKNKKVIYSPNFDAEEKTGVYELAGEKILFKGKFLKGKEYITDSNSKLFVSKDNKAPRVKIEQTLLLKPEIKIEDISGFIIKEVRINKIPVCNNITNAEDIIDTSLFKNLEYGYHDIDMDVEDGVGNKANFASRFLAPGVFSIDSSVIYPNPASNFMQLSYTLGTATVSRVTINIYDVSGKRVFRDVSGINVGKNIFVWDLKDNKGRNVANGLYFIKIKAVDNSGDNIEKILKAAVLR